MPLRILLPAIGSSGDIHPVIGIGRALKARGHRVTVVTNDIFSAQIRASGLEFIALGTKAEAEAVMSDPGLWHERKGFRVIFEKAVLPHIRPLYEIIAAHRGPSSVVAATTLCLGARVAQERLGVPTASLHLQPLVFRSLGEYGRLGFLDLGPGMPRFVKRALFWIGDTALIDPLVGPPLNAFRAELGLGPVRGIFSSYLHSPQLVLGLFPEWFAPPQPDWPPNTHLTGFILHDDDGRAALPDDAEAFLAAGTRPIVVTPGSAAMDRGRFLQTTVDACRATGTRAMLVTNFPGHLPKDLPEGVRAFSYLPFSRLLPRCAAIAYHGGVGTLAQTVRAGVPHLVVANTFDQPDNGQRIERFGLGIAIGQGRYRAGNAARAIGELLHSPEIARRCAEFAPRVDPHASIERACSLIEQLA
jgi:UDP:flavonoid glycosyltransferase YjiC (YdhE family)